MKKITKKDSEALEKLWSEAYMLLWDNVSDIVDSYRKHISKMIDYYYKKEDLLRLHEICEVIQWNEHKNLSDDIKKLSRKFNDLSYFDKKNIESINWYKNEILKTLNINELPPYLDDAINACELDTMLVAVEGCILITEHEKKPRNAQRLEERFINIQNKYQAICEEVGLPFVPKDFRYKTKDYYEDVLRARKAQLFKALCDECGTGINRAKALSEILEEI